MITHIIPRRPTVRWFGVAAATSLFVGTPALAQQFVSKGPPPDDPVLQWAQQIAPRNQFFIDSDQNVEVIRFKTARDLELCAGLGHDRPGFLTRGYPIKVSWDNQTALIAPGNCLAFDAARVSVSAGSHLPENVILTGTFRVTK